jgi:hypothetical protein
MSIIKEKIKYAGSGMTINFGLSSNNSFLGYQQEIDNLTQVVSLDLVNPEIDVEERRFKSFNSSMLIPQLEFQFFSGTYQNNFLAAGFTLNNILYNASNILNSFFIMDFYNTYDVNTQIKIFTTYLTKIGIIPLYDINATNQLYYWYIPMWYLNAQTGSTITGYAKFTFYNAKTGTIALFYNNDNLAYTTPEKMYFKVEINIPNKTWKFTNPSFPLILAKQLYTSTQYNQRVNDTVTNFNNEAQNYPSGQTFNYLDGKYNTV